MRKAHFMAFWGFGKPRVFSKLDGCAREFFSVPSVPQLGHLQMREAQAWGFNKDVLCRAGNLVRGTDSTPMTVTVSSPQAF